jgi:hypothetical protein
MTDPDELEDRARYVKALPELLASLPPDETVDVIDLSNEVVRLCPECVRLLRSDLLFVDLLNRP